jgi:hypothetical protein
MGTTENNPLSLQQYADLIGFEGGKDPSLEQIQEYAEDYQENTFWDYPLNELKYLIEDNRKFLFVQCEDEIRLCEY